jgi:hypothetical protein
VLTPAYGRAAAQSVLTDGLRSAPPSAAAVTVSAESSAAGAQGGSFDPAQQSTSEAKALVDNAFKKAPHLAAVLDKPITAVETDAVSDSFVARLAWRLGACSQLKINGSCAIDADQVIVSERSAADAGIKVGDQVTLRGGKGAAKKLQVVGLYTPKDPAAVYWGNSAYFAHSTLAPEGLPRLDAIFTGTEDDVRLPGATAISVRLTYPLKAEALRLDDVPALRTELGALGLSLNASELQLETALLSIVDDAAKDQAVLGKSVPLIAVPLLVLAWVVLLLLVAALTEERSPELALARLRGFPTGRVSRFGLGETLVLVTLGAPVGAIAGLGLVELTCRAILAPGTNVELRWPVFAAAGAGLLATYAAAWLATRRTFAQGVLTLLRRVPQRARKRAGVIEAIAVTVALAALVALAAGSFEQPGPAGAGRAGPGGRHRGGPPAHRVGPDAPGGGPPRRERGRNPCRRTACPSAGDNAHRRGVDGRRSPPRLRRRLLGCGAARARTARPRSPRHANGLHRDPSQPGGAGRGRRGGGPDRALDGRDPRRAGIRAAQGGAAGRPIRTARRRGHLARP